MKTDASSSNMVYGFRMHHEEEEEEEEARTTERPNGEDASGSPLAV